MIAFHDDPTPIVDVNNHSAADHAANQPQSQWPVGQEPWRPSAHFTPKRMWMNDPNGMIYHDGLYHLFYQFHPDSMIWGPMHWGHATSRDLLSWEHHDVALYPDEHGTMFSGCCVNDRHNSSGLFAGPGTSNLTAIFSYDNQSLGLATSVDGGLTWQHYRGNPIMPAVKEDFRDPKVFWHAPTQKWVMAISAHRECYFYTSPNLIDWTFASAFSGGCTVGVWEVPDLFQLTDPQGSTHWVLLMSVNDGALAGGSGIQYFIGNFDGVKFHWDASQGARWLDFGPDNYAGSTWFDEPDNDKLYIGWMSNWPYANKVPTDPWRGCLTLPRKLQLFDNGQGLEVGGFPKVWPTANGDTLQVLELSFSADDGLRQSHELLIKGQPTGHVLTVDFEEQTLVLDRPQALRSMFKDARMPLGPQRDLRFKLIFDNGVIELFDLQTGRCISQVSFGPKPSKPQPTP